MHSKIERRQKEIENEMKGEREHGLFVYVLQPLLQSHNLQLFIITEIYFVRKFNFASLPGINYQLGYISKYLNWIEFLIQNLMHDSFQSNIFSMPNREKSFHATRKQLVAAV